jgi:hypothetical protein
LGTALKWMALSGAFIASIAVLHADDGGLNLPTWPQPRERFSASQGCVEPTEVMRKNHMRFLFHERDLTVHEGIRDTRYSLVGCVSCHVGTDQNGKFIPINAAGQFCQSCHAYEAVQVDCFQCHATTPGPGVSGEPLRSSTALSTAMQPLGRQVAR